MLQESSLSQGIWPHLDELASKARIIRSTAPADSAIASNEERERFCREAPLASEAIEAEPRVVVLVGLDVDEANRSSSELTSNGVNDIHDRAASSVRADRQGGEDEHQRRVGGKGSPDRVPEQLAVRRDVGRDFAEAAPV